MYKYISIVLITLFFTSCGISQKEYDKTVTQYKQELDSSNKKIAELEEIIDYQTSKILDRDKRIYNQRQEHQQEIEQLLSQEPTGVYYRIQIGVLKNPRSKSESNQFLTKDGGYYKWRIGYSPTMKDAELARRDLRILGIKSSWIVPMKDGNTITLEQIALEKKISDREY